MTPEMLKKMKMLKDKMMAMKDSNPEGYASSNGADHQDYLDKMMSECDGGCGGEEGTDLTVVVSSADQHNPLMQKFDDAVAMLDKSEQKIIMHMKDMRGSLSPEGQKVAMLLWKIYAMGPEKNSDLNKRMTDYEGSI